MDASREVVSVIVPTIGRPGSLRRLLESVGRQTFAVHEVIVADGSSSGETAAVVDDPRWRDANLRVVRVPVQPPNAVSQRQAAIAASSGDLLLLLDDDVELEPGYLGVMIDLLRRDPGIAAVTGDYSNQTWPEPTRAWRFYLRHVLGLGDGTWQGRVVGPLMRFGYTPSPTEPQPMEWFSTASTLLRRAAYEQAGGFSAFFLHRSTMNEDVDLALKVSRVGRIVFCPAARMGHFHDPGGRVSPMVAAEDDLYNRYLIMRDTQGRAAVAAFGQVLLFFCLESASSFVGCLMRGRTNGLGSRTLGRFRALVRVAMLPRAH